MLALAPLAAALALAGGMHVYADPAGDAGGAPDVTAVTVGATADAFDFGFTVAGMTAGTTLSVYLDTDRNARTGSYSGSEYAVEAGIDSGGHEWSRLVRWTDNAWEAGPATLTVAGSVWSLRIAREAIGSPAAFDLYCFSALLGPGGTILAEDWIPDTGDLSFKPVTIGAATVAPAPRAGSRVTVRFPTDADTATAAVTVGRRPVPFALVVRNGSANVTLTIPKRTRGQVLRVTLTCGEARADATFRVR
jgi:hypothetical protein